MMIRHVLCFAIRLGKLSLNAWLRKHPLILEATDHFHKMPFSGPQRSSAKGQHLGKSGSRFSSAFFQATPCNTLDASRRYARAVLVDMEPKVINNAISTASSSPSNWCYAPGSSYAQQSGSGNNWARGHNLYGPKHAEVVCELVRHEVHHNHFVHSPT